MVENLHALTTRDRPTRSLALDEFLGAADATRERQRLFDPADAIVCSAHPIFCAAHHGSQHGYFSHSGCV
jgi:hypothetical protein